MITTTTWLIEFVDDDGVTKLFRTTQLAEQDAISAFKRSKYGGKEIISVDQED